MSQIKYLFTTFSNHLRGPTLNAKTIVCLTSTSFSGYSLSLIHHLAQWQRYIWPWERSWFHSIIQTNISKKSTSTHEEWIKVPWGKVQILVVWIFLHLFFIKKSVVQRLETVMQCNLHGTYFEPCDEWFIF